jgi:hypothetical protein
MRFKEKRSKAFKYFEQMCEAKKQKKRAQKPKEPTKKSRKRTAKVKAKAKVIPKKTPTPGNRKAGEAPKYKDASEARRAFRHKKKHVLDMVKRARSFIDGRRI